MRIIALPSEANFILTEVKKFAPNAQLWRGAVTIGFDSPGQLNDLTDPTKDPNFVMGPVAVLGTTTVNFEGNPVNIKFSEWVGYLCDRRTIPQLFGGDTMWYKTLSGWKTFPYKLEAYTPDGSTGELRWAKI